MTTIYTVHVDHATEGSIAVPTLREAREVRANCDAGSGAITRIKVGKMPMRELLCAVYNREGFAAEMEDLMPDKSLEDE